MFTQNQILVAVGALVVVGLVYYFLIRKTDAYEWSSNVSSAMGKLDYFDPAVNGPEVAQNEMGMAMVPGESAVVMADTEPATADTTDLLNYFENQYSGGDSSPELRARETRKLRFKENVKQINPQITVDEHPDLDLQYQIEGVDIKDVSTYDNNHRVPMSYVSKKLYDSFNTTVGPRQVYPLDGDYVKVSNFGIY
jgi:hypothetical protein